MNTSFARFSLACALALTMSVASAKAEATAAKITSIGGSAQYSTDGQNWQTLTKGMPLQAGAIIRTAAGSHVDVLLGSRGAATASEATIGNLIYFPDAGAEQANMIRVLENTVLSIDTLTETQTGVSAVNNTQLDLRKGAVFFSVKKLAADSSFEIKCPKGIAGVRGTLGWMNDLGQIRLSRGTIVETYYGADGATTKTQVIQGKQMFDPATGLLQGCPDDILKWLGVQGRELLGAQAVGTPPPSTYIKDTTQLITSPVVGQSEGGYDGGETRATRN